MKQYKEWLQTGYEQERLAGVFPRVLWHSPSAERHQELTQLIANAEGPEGLHVTTGLLLTPEGAS